MRDVTEHSYEQVQMLLSEIDRWHARGLIDRATRERLRAHYLQWRDRSRAACAAPPEEPPRETAGAGHAPDEREDPCQLELELEQEAAAVLARDPPPEPSLDDQLALEVAVHTDLQAAADSARSAEQQRRALLDARPVASRSACVGEALCAVAAGLALGQNEQEPVPSLEQRALEHEGLWAGKLRPFFHDNALWLAGGLLVVFGSLYFLRLIWNDLSNEVMHAVIAGALHAYAGGFFAAGYLLVRRKGAHAVGLILFCFTSALLPLASVATGELAAVLLARHGAAGGALALLAVALALSGQALMLALVGGLYQRSAMRLVLGTGLGLAATTMLVAPLKAFSGSAALLLVPAGLAVAMVGFRLVPDVRPRLRATILFVGGTMLWAFVVLAARVHVAQPVEPTYYASLIAALAGLLISTDGKLRARSGLAPRLSAIGLCLHAVLLAAFTLSLAGLVRQGYFDVWARVNVLATSTIATWFFALAARDHGRSVMTYLAASAGLLAYFFIPAPFQGLLLLAKEWVESALGYANQPLPAAYYGLVFMPYLALLTLLALRFARRGRPDLSLDLQRFVIALGGVVLALSLTAGADLRPVLWTWPAYAAAAFWGAKVFSRPSLAHAGHVIVVGFAWCLGIWLEGLWPGLLVAGYGLAMACTAVRPAAPRHLAIAAAWATVVGLATLFFSPAVLVGATAGGTSTFLFHGETSAGQVACTTLLAVTSLGTLAWRFASRIAAQGAALSSVVTLVASLAFFAASAEQSLVAFFLYSALAAGGAWSCRRRGLAAVGSELHTGLRHRLIAQPLIVVGTLAAVVAFLGSLILAPRWGSLAAALLLWVYALLSRSWASMGLGAIGGAAGLVACAHDIAASHAMLILSPLAALYLLGARRSSIARSLPDRRAWALEACAFICAATFLWLGLARLGPLGTYDTYWAALTSGGIALFCLAATWAYRASAGASVVALWGLGASAAGSLAWTMHGLAEGVGETKIWSQGLLFNGLAFVWSLASVRLRPAALARAARRIGATALLVPVACLLPSLLLPLVEHDSARNLSLFGTAPGLLALACAAATLFASFSLTVVAHERDRAMALAGQQLTIGALVLAAGVISLALAPGAHLAVALAAVAVLLSWMAARDEAPGPRSIPSDGRALAAWALALAGLALLASHLHPSQPDLLLAALGATTVLWLLARRSQSRKEHALWLAWAIGVATALQLLTIWIAEELSTGRYPPSSVLALMAPTALAGWAVLHRIGARRTRSVASSRAADAVARANPILAAALALLALSFTVPLPGFVQVLSLSTLTVTLGLLWRRGIAEQREWLLHAACAVGVALYAALRLYTPISRLGIWIDVAIVLLAAQIALHAVGGLGRLARRPLLAAALGVPLVGSICLLPQLDAMVASLYFLLVGTHYGIAAQLLHSRALRAVSLGCGNAALFCSWAALGWSDLQLYAIPAGLTALVLIQLYREDLGPTARHVLRNAVLIAIYVLATAKTLVATTPVQALIVVPSLCIVGIAAGSLLRIRSYVLMGVGFLAIDLLANMARYGLANRPLGALFLTLLGLAVVAAMVVYSLEKERILRRYSAILAELRAWD